ncbi:hypothetical protein Pcinc_010418 [Petrolisthes cinctipes]|uniref:Uncharacterized protein n=1 Tax=Petrolisthes cinctipes TaxID=88211 RepID=A0AAE1G2U6_PETCI|nr:hypothetical protein Pcinc_010418 [Petrolisthes cinctipes]
MPGGTVRSLVLKHWTVVTSVLATVDVVSKDVYMWPATSPAEDNLCVDIYVSSLAVLIVHLAKNHVSGNVFTVNADRSVGHGVLLVRNAVTGNVNTTNVTSTVVTSVPENHVLVPATKSSSVIILVLVSVENLVHLCLSHSLQTLPPLPLPTETLFPPTPCKHSLLSHSLLKHFFLPLPAVTLPPLPLPTETLPPLPLPAETLPPLPTETLPALPLPTETLPPLPFPAETLPPLPLPALPLPAETLPALPLLY